LIFCSEWWGGETLPLFMRQVFSTSIIFLILFEDEEYIGYSIASFRTILKNSPVFAKYLKMYLTTYDTDDKVNLNPGSTFVFENWSVSIDGIACYGFDINNQEVEKEIIYPGMIVQEGEKLQPPTHVDAVVKYFY
jgi:hypothetical protein